MGAIHTPSEVLSDPSGVEAVGAPSPVEAHIQGIERFENSLWLLTVFSLAIGIFAILIMIAAFLPWTVISDQGKDPLFQFFGGGFLAFVSGVVGCTVEIWRRLLRREIANLRRDSARDERVVELPEQNVPDVSPTGSNKRST